MKPRLPDPVTCGGPLTISLALLGLGLLWPAGAKADPTAADAIDLPKTAQAELEAGNRRYVAGKRTRSIDTGKDAALRERLVEAQKPFAVVVTCSDSRVPDNIVFDQEPGRLFTVREAGATADQQGIASVEYAVQNLGAKIILVMGHSSCGAVKAVQEAKGRPLPGNLWVFQANMAGLLESTPPRSKEDSKDYTARLVETNAKRQSQLLIDRSEVIRQFMQAGKVWIAPAVYDLKSGAVKFLDRPTVPTQSVAKGH